MFSSLAVNKLKFDTYFLPVPSVWQITHIKPSMISHWFSNIKDDSSDRYSSSILSKVRSTDIYHTLANCNICWYLTNKITKFFLSVPHQHVYKEISKYFHNHFSIKTHGIKSCISAVMHNVRIATRPVMFLFSWDLILIITFSLPLCCKLQILYLCHLLTVQLCT